MPSARKPKLGHHWTFQQDNNTKHASPRFGLRKGGSRSSKILESPDLNAIENLLWDWKKAVAVYKHEKISELETIVQKKLAMIPWEVLLEDGVVLN